MPSSHQEEGSYPKRAYWEDQIQQWKQSGLSQSSYCRLHGIRYRQWVYWRKRIGQAQSQVTFIPLQLKEIPRPPCSPGICVIAPNGFRIELHGASIASVGQLIREVAAI
jgi:hypothetical protein